MLVGRREALGFGVAPVAGGVGAGGVAFYDPCAESLCGALRKSRRRGRHWEAEFRVLQQRGRDLLKRLHPRFPELFPVDCSDLKSWAVGGAPACARPWPRTTRRSPARYGTQPSTSMEISALRPGAHRLFHHLDQHLAFHTIARQHREHDDLPLQEPSQQIGILIRTQLAFGLRAFQAFLDRP